MSTSSLHRGIAISNVMLFVTLIVLLTTGFGRDQRAPELTVERLNIVDSSGRTLLVLANPARLPGATFGGKEYPPAWVERTRSAGMIFFNEQGDEVGGLIYEGYPRDSSYQAGGQLSFDQWRQNQVVAMQYADNGRQRRAGLGVWDRPTDAPLSEQFRLAEAVRLAPAGPRRDSLERERLRTRERVQGAQRLFVGSRDRTAMLELRDPQGRVRARLGVDSLGVGRLEFLDDRGQVRNTISQSPR